MRLIDADVLVADFMNYADLEFDGEGVANFVSHAPTVDAVPVDVVAQMLADAFGDFCPCNYNDNDEWLPMVCDEANALCGDHEDKLHCWKQYIKHYGERRNGDE